MLRTALKDFSKAFVRQKCTSAFTETELKALKIRYVGVRSIHNIFPKSANIKPFEHLLLQNMSGTELCAIDLMKDRRFSDEQKGLIHRLQRIIINESGTLGTEESKTADMVGDILVMLGLNKFPLSVSRQARFKFNLGLDEDVTSQPSFTVGKQEQVLFVHEDQHSKNMSSIKQWGELQLAGEMLVCGLATSKLEGDISVHGMRVVGTRFSFYHAMVTEAFYMHLANPDRPHMEIKRFPTFDNSNDSLETMSLDFKHPTQRKHIVDALARLTNELCSQQC